MEPEPVAEPTPAPAPKWPVRVAAQKAAEKNAADDATASLLDTNAGAEGETSAIES